MGHDTSIWAQEVGGTGVCMNVDIRSQPSDEASAWHTAEPHVFLGLTLGPSLAVKK